MYLQKIIMGIGETEHASIYAIILLRVKKTDSFFTRAYFWAHKSKCRQSGYFLLCI